MKSKWFDLKYKAIKLRQQGSSLREVEKLLKIPKSTLSGWFKNIELTSEQKQRLKNNLLDNLSKARKNAVIWHNQQKEMRLKTAENEAKNVLSIIDMGDKSILELTLAILYLGEGAKSDHTCIGSSDPLILKFFIKGLIKVYGFDVKRIKCELHLRVDQNPNLVKEYWAKELNLSLSNFYSTSIDKRTAGSKTYPTYNGVCVLQCGNIAIQRRLLSLSRLFCEKVALDKGS